MPLKTFEWKKSWWWVIFQGSFIFFHDSFLQTQSESDFSQLVINVNLLIATSGFMIEFSKSLVIIHKNADHDYEVLLTIRKIIRARFFRSN